MNTKLLFAIMMLAAAPAAAQRSTASIPVLGEPVADVQEVLVRRTWVENSVQLAAEATARRQPRPASRATAFAILKRNTESGQFVCEIVAIKPRVWNDSAMDDVGHELMHCFGYQHD